MSTRIGLARALSYARKKRGLAQEAFSDVSSRTYISSIEREEKSPTMEKLEQLSTVLDINVATLVVLATMFNERKSAGEVLDRVRKELEELSHDKSEGQ